jgi:predicted membrane GTPase involved in stress response
MDKKTFCKLMRYAQEHLKLLDGLYDIIRPDARLVSVFDNVIELIIESEFDYDQADTIYWWLYEDGREITIDNKEIQLKTAEDLYDVLPHIKSGE